MVRSLVLFGALVFGASAAWVTPTQAQQPDAKAAAKPAAPAAAGPLKTQKDKVSYSIGLDIGKNFKNQGIDVDPNLLARGIRDVLAGNKVLLTEDEVHTVMMEFQTAMREQHAKKQQVSADKNLKDGAAFLETNKSKDGVKTTASGLQYKVLKEGTGKAPTLESTVTAHYRGTLLDGTEFDSSYKRGQPASFPVSGVIPGWTEVLQLMKVGGKVTVWIPASLGYGERGAGNVIGPNAMLTFDIELLDVTQ
ncbi:MAG TPA: FKBP-type peptidyl-prolyl cis-trans isomerase [bacterium]